MNHFSIHGRLYLVSSGCALILLVILAVIAPRVVSKTFTQGSELFSLASTTPVTHIRPPQAVKGVYVTSYVAGSEKLRAPILSLLDTTEVNAVVIDIKDYSGHVSYEMSEPTVRLYNIAEKRVRDMPALLERIHAKGAYVIGRIAVFQDPWMVAKRPELAVKRASDKNMVWKDYKGVSWIDPGAKEYWRYIVSLSKVAYVSGFDEINFDYIRFPSDGNMNDIYYPKSNGQVKAQVMKEFFAYVHKELSGTGIILSADLFGMTTTNTDDLNIGQTMENALPYFHYISPMVYPSHYPPGFNGYKNPAEMPYEVVKYSMDKAFLRASTTPYKIRPWLQDFNLGAVYTAEMVRAQIKATYDAGFSSWLLWNSRSVYTKGAFLGKQESIEAR